MRSQWRNWYDLAKFSSDDDHYRADSLRFVLTVTIPVFALILLAKIISVISLGYLNDLGHLPAGHFYTLVVLASIVSLQITSALLLKRGLLRLPSYIAITSIWLAYAVAALYSGVVFLMGGFVGLMVIATILFGVRALVLFAGINLTVLVLFFASGEPVSKAPDPITPGIVLYYTFLHGFFLLLPTMLLVRFAKVARRLRDQTHEAAQILREQNIALQKEVVVRQEAEAKLLVNQSRLQLALESGNLSTWRFDPARQEMIVNDAWISNMPDVSQRLSFAEFVELIHPEDRAATKAIYGQALEPADLGKAIASPFHTEYRLWSPEGQYRWVAVSGRVTYDPTGQPVRISGVMQDIEARKAAESKQLALRMAEERAHSLSDFLGTISHDLKTPLSVIRSNLYLIDHVPDVHKQHDWLQQIERQTLYLEQFIQDILAMSRLEHTKHLTFQMVDLGNLIREVATSLQPKVEQKQQTLILDLGAGVKPILGSYTELSRGMTNLVENAINYTDEQGNITVRSREEEGMPVIEVADTGIGIAPDEIPKIFDRFHRSDAAKKLQPLGSGLGLALVHRIVEIHQGSIEVDSQLGQGTTFRLRLPRLVEELELTPA